MPLLAVATLFFACSCALVAAPFRAGFTEVDSARAGIAFTNHLPNERIFENLNLMNGSGVAAGDFDGDGLSDLYFCAVAGTNALYRNLGGWQFTNVTAEAGVACAHLASSGAVFADADGDGDLDLFVSTLGLGVHFFRNEGEGRFSEQTAAAGLQSATGSTTLALADVEGDGDLDLYVANYGARAILRGGGRADARLVNGRMVLVGTNAYRLRIVDGRIEEVGEPDVLYLNDARGRFQKISWNSDRFLDEAGRPREEPWDFGLTAVMRDFTGDGAPDIYVCNDFQTVDRLWVNDGKGRFRLIPRLGLRKQSFSAMGVDAADIDRDGLLDFFITEMLPSTLDRRLRSISGVAAFFPAPGMVENRPELIRNTLFWNRGDGSFAEVAEYAGVAATDWSWQPLFLDVDLDGYEDLLVGNGVLHDVQDRDAIERTRALMSRSPDQNRANVLMFPPYKSPNLAFRNESGLRFAKMSQAWGFSSTRISQGACLADLDNDGDLDVVYNTLRDGPLLCRNDAEAPRVSVRLAGEGANRFGIGASIWVKSAGLPVQMQEMIAGGKYLSGDDTIRAFAARGPSEIEVRWRSGRTTTVAHAEAGRIHIVRESEAVETPPRQGKAKQSLLENAAAALGHKHHDEQFDDYSYQPLLPLQLSQRGPGLAALDLDGDGLDELIAGTGAGKELAVLKVVGGRFETWPAAKLPVARDDLLAMCAWATESGGRSLLIAQSHYESRQPHGAILQLSAADGALRLEPLELDLPGSVIGALTAADVDGDGDLDLFVGGHFNPGEYPLPCASRLFEQEGGRLRPHPDSDALFGSLGRITSALWADLDSDGFAELVLAQEWGPIQVFRNDRGKLSPATEAFGLAAHTGLWTGLAAGDFDSDGRIDLVAGNWGENTSWKASAQHPLRLYHSVRAGELGVKLIEAEFAPEIREYGPVRSYGIFLRAFPELAKKFPNHAAFSKAALPQIAAALAEPIAHVSAASLQSCVLLNRGGRLDVRPLPLEAQLSPAFGPAACDLNGDGHLDILLAQNFFAFRPELARADAGCGLVLLGRGDGAFAPLGPAESGVSIPGEQRGGAAGRFFGDGRFGIAVGQNAGPAQLFLSKQGGRRMKLAGPPGNPDGIGAILRFDLGGKVLAHPVVSGGGWLSQSTLAAAVPPAAKSVEVIWPGGKRTKHVIAGGEPIEARQQ